MAAEIDAEDYKCWICLDGPQDEPPPGQSAHNWRRPCGCHITAHESCLLEWVSEVNSRQTGLFNKEDKLPRCPQCKAVIRVKAAKSRWVTVRDSIESINVGGYRFFLFSTIGGSMVSTVYTTLYAFGATTIRCLCPTDMALDLLGITVTETGFQMQALSLKKMLLIPSIPLVLLMSKVEGSPLVDTLLCLLPLTLSDRQTPPWKFSGPRFTLALVPFARLVYNLGYNALVEPFIQSCAASVRPIYQNNVINLNEAARQARAFDFRIEIQREEFDGDDGDDGNNGDNGGDGDNGGNGDNGDNGDNGGNGDNDGNGDNGGNADGQFNNVNGRVNVGQNDLDNNNNNNNHNRQGILDRFDAQLFNLLLRTLDRVIPQEPNPLDNDIDQDERIQPQELVEFAGAQQRPQIRRRQIQGTANWIISKPSWTLWIGNTLIFPVLSGLVGEALSGIPMARKLIPSRFNRNIAGGALLILLRDIINMTTAYLRARQQQDRRVLNFYESD